MSSNWVNYVRNKIRDHNYQEVLKLKIRDETYTIYGKGSFSIDGVPFDMESYNVGVTSLSIIGVRRGIIISLIIYYSEITAVE